MRLWLPSLDIGLPIGCGTIFPFNKELPLVALVTMVANLLYFEIEPPFDALLLRCGWQPKPGDPTTLSTTRFTEIVDYLLHLFTSEFSTCPMRPYVALVTLNKVSFRRDALGTFGHLTPFKFRALLTNKKTACGPLAVGFSKLERSCCRLGDVLSFVQCQGLVSNRDLGPKCGAEAWGDLV